MKTSLGTDVSNNTLAASAIAGSFSQAPIVSIGVLSAERVASVLSNLAISECVDAYMSQISSWWPVAPISVSKVQSTQLLSRPRFAEDQSVDLALADEELEPNERNRFGALSNKSKCCLQELGQSCAQVGGSTTVAPFVVVP